MIIGHEFCGELVTVGARWKSRFKPGDKFSIQPALNYRGSLEAPGYSFPFIGGDATYIVIPAVVMEQECLLPYAGEAFFAGSLAEPMSCIAGAFHASYHTTPGSHVHDMGIRDKGRMAILAGAGPMGLGAIDYALHPPPAGRRPELLAVTDIDDARLNRTKRLFPEGPAGEHGVKLVYVNTSDSAGSEARLRELTGNKGYDDVLVMAPVAGVIESADRLLGFDGCLNFFAGPGRPDFRASVNFYNVHYSAAHAVGTSGGNTDDMKEALDLMAAGKINPAVMVTHIGGLNAVAEATLRLPELPGGKKLIYTHIDMELTAIEAFHEKGKSDRRFEALGQIIDGHNGLWSPEAERFLLKNF